MEQPAWLNAAWAELGVQEKVGSADSARVVSYYREAGHGEIVDDEVPWCAAFAGAMLKRAGLEGTGSLMARSYLAWGEPLETPRLGAIAVLERGSDPAAGHVGFLVGETPDALMLLGGNQTDSVCVAAFDVRRLIALRWPAQQASTPAPEPPPKEQLTPSIDDASFAAALANVLELEGGFSDDPYDPGGPTNKGVTLAVYAAFKGVKADASTRTRLLADLKRIPDGDVRAIYRTRYWAPAQCAAMVPAIALFHFDAAVNHGVRGAARMLQRALGVTADGIVGPRTLAALANRDAAKLIDSYAAIRRDRYRALAHFWRFGRGWLNRVDVSATRAHGLIGKDQSEAETRKGGSAMEQADETVKTGKWWAQSKTIWGALITAVATLAPALGPLLGIDLSGDVIRQAGEQTFGVIQAIAGLIGTLLTIYGRLRADGPIVRRSVSLRL